jgi:hypothetical protein
MSNSTSFKEHRTYNHKDTSTSVEFYFITRIWNDYMLDVLKQMEVNPPDILIINSALWDLHRYGRWADEQYEKNIQKAASRLEDVMTTGEDTGSRLLIWSMSLPVDSKSRAGFVDRDYTGTVGSSVYAANQTAKAVMRRHKAEVVDFYYFFKKQVHHRVRDGVHWDRIAHRRITNYLLILIANHFYGKDHPKSHKAKMILAGSPISDTPMAVPKRRPWLPNSNSEFLYTPEVTGGYKENGGKASNHQETPGQSHSSSLDCTIYDLRDKLNKRRQRRSRFSSPSDDKTETDAKRPRNDENCKPYQNEKDHGKSQDLRVVSYVKKGWQKVREFFGHRAKPAYRYSSQRKFPKTTYAGGYNHYKRGYYQHYDYGLY